ncbi:hypothetical protein ACFX2B_013918 [Malus domestica]
MKVINFLPVYDENKIGEYLVRVSGIPGEQVLYLLRRFQLHTWYYTPSISIPVFDNRCYHIFALIFAGCCLCM